MKVVLLDVYETLLTGRRLPDPEPAMQAVARSFGLSHDGRLELELSDRIAKAHRESPDPHPEIDIRGIWRDIFPELGDVDAFALAVENAVHPVAAMPGAAEAIHRLHEKGLRLGVVSNGQAYTRTFLQKYLGTAAGLLDRELMIFSYEYRIAKPDPRLFQLALSRIGLPASEVLFIGDSRDRDIAPAGALGMRTRLFTGWDEDER